MSVSDGAGRMPAWAQVRVVAQHAETAGLDSARVCDHLLSGPLAGSITRCAYKITRLGLR